MKFRNFTSTDVALYPNTNDAFGQNAFPSAIIKREELPMSGERKVHLPKKRTGVYLIVPPEVKLAKLHRSDLLHVGVQLHRPETEIAYIAPATPEIVKIMAATTA